MVSNSMSTRSGSPLHKSLAIWPIRTEAAECELEGPRITGPTTSLKMLGGRVVAIARFGCLLVVVGWMGRDAEHIVVEAAFEWLVVAYDLDAAICSNLVFEIKTPVDRVSAESA